MSLQEGKASTISYKTSEGISKKMSKLNLNSNTANTQKQIDIEKLEEEKCNIT